MNSDLIELGGVSLSQLEFVRLNAPEFYARAVKMKEALIVAASRCSWCDGTQQDNDGENFINESCPKCQQLWDAIQK